MSKVVDWQKRAERLANLCSVGLAYIDPRVDKILRDTERDEPDAAPASQPAFEAGQWVRHTHSGRPYQVRECRCELVWFYGYDDHFGANSFARIPDRPTDEWMRDNAPGWRLTGRVEDCTKGGNVQYVTANGENNRAYPAITRDSVGSNAAYCDGYRWTVERIPEHDALRAELASIRARLDEIAKMVGAA